EQELEAAYLAQAGVMDAVVDYRDGGSWTAKENIQVGENRYYHVGRAANFLWVDASASQISGKKLSRVPIKNINGSSSVTITRMTVSWTFGGRIKKVSLGDESVWEGSASSGDNLDIEYFTMAAGAEHSGSDDQEWEFSKNVSGTVVATFTFSDGSGRTVSLLSDGAPTNKEFSITSTGEARANTTWRRTIEATYDTGTGAITSWQETSAHIIP
ncbi:MAG: hypothetical protein HY589_02600, partial [Candidatus Omnitrophica bacterium]|nr:hypothetical protein [Candidatus Omnitrophota bacterium]